MKTIEVKSSAYQLLELVWKRNEIKSWMPLNKVMCDALVLAIDAKLEFFENDITDIFNNFRGSYWFGYAKRRNGGYGVHLYCHAAKTLNTNACMSFEKNMGISPFILKNRRTYINLKFANKETQKYYRVTGFDLDKKIIRLMFFDNQKETGKYSICRFNNKEWNEFRKNIIKVNF